MNNPRNPATSCTATRDGIIVGYENGNVRSFRYERSYYDQRQNYNPPKRRFTTEQWRKYRELVYGFKAFSQEELAAMSEQQRREISKNYTIAQKELNKMKNERVEEISFFVSNSLFKDKKRSKIRGILEENCEDCHHFPNFMDFKTLGIKQEDILERLIKVRILQPDVTR